MHIGVFWNQPFALMTLSLAMADLNLLVAFMGYGSSMEFMFHLICRLFMPTFLHMGDLSTDIYCEGLGCFAR